MYEGELNDKGLILKEVDVHHKVDAKACAPIRFGTYYRSLVLEYCGPKASVWLIIRIKVKWRHSATHVHFCTPCWKQVSGGFDVGRTKDLTILHFNEV